MDPRGASQPNKLVLDASQPNKLVLELWFNLSLNECLGLDAVGVNLLIAAFRATFEFLTLWICKRLSRNGKLG